MKLVECNGTGCWVTEKPWEYRRIPEQGLYARKVIGAAF